MSCLSMTITPQQPATLAVGPVANTKVSVSPVPQTRLSVSPETAAALAVIPADSASLGIVPDASAVLTVGEVCSITSGTIVVLAASDGPLRTRDGGYLLLNPATNPPED